MLANVVFIPFLLSYLSTLESPGSRKKTLGMWKYSDVEGSFFGGEGGGGGWELVSHLLDLEVHHVSCITFNSHIIISSYVWGIPISELSLHDDSHLSIVAALVQWWLTLQLQKLNCWLCLLLKFWLLWGAFFSTLLNAFIYSVLCNLSNRNNYRI